MPVFPPPPTDKDGRQDVLLLKQQLAEALGDNGPSYWQALTDFVSGKLNRQEFDFYANLYLSRKNAPLHNQFILANIHNAQREAPPPTTRSVGWSKGKKSKEGTKEQEPKRRKIKNQVMSLGKAERERIKSLKEQNRNNGAVKQKLKEHRISKPLAPPLPQPSIVEYNRGAHAPLCFDSKELPDFEAMKDRMTAIAMENGLLGGVHDDCIELMLHALEGASFNSSSKRTTTITAKDLAFAIDISPSMLVENPINVEKLMSILMEESDDDADEDMDGQDDMESDSALFEV
ncbi:hypothetical protein BG006_003019 [Podila minutissima]|uniref:Transcriptional regulator of RNA polII, SAGA, subunit-domain-containing protein n=1 Tax=Podila minutissima TaxID=64525 RepID=A0A9P5VG17_9FUNG|nr:hypothetical protein BG006_003019 [Podila minutissima]